jgi:hypothetical protein
VKFLWRRASPTCQVVPRHPCAISQRSSVLPAAELALHGLPDEVAVRRRR